MTLFRLVVEGKHEATSDDRNYLEGEARYLTGQGYPARVERVGSPLLKALGCVTVLAATPVLLASLFGAVVYGAWCGAFGVLLSVVMVGVGLLALDAGTEEA